MMFGGTFGSRVVVCGSNTPKSPGKQRGPVHEKSVNGAQLFELDGGGPRAILLEVGWAAGRWPKNMATSRVGPHEAAEIYEILEAAGRPRIYAQQKKLCRILGERMRKVCDPKRHIFRQPNAFRIHGNSIYLPAAGQLLKKGASLGKANGGKNCEVRNDLME